MAFGHAGGMKAISRLSASHRRRPKTPCIPTGCQRPCRYWEERLLASLQDADLSGRIPVVSLRSTAANRFDASGIGYSVP
jgi:hypothetical protein